MTEEMFERFWRFCYVVVEKMLQMEDYRNCSSFIYFTQFYKTPAHRPAYIAHSYQTLPFAKQKDFWVRCLSNFMEDAASSDMSRSAIYTDLYEKNKHSLDFLFQDKFMISRLMESVRKINGVGDGGDMMQRIEQLERRPLETSIPDYIVMKPFQQ